MIVFSPPLFAELRALQGLRLGVDVADVAAIEASMLQFGDRFVNRIFSPGEIVTAKGKPERLAVRFAAKEATIKALDLSDVGVDWRDIEVSSSPSGSPELHLRGTAKARADQAGLTASAISLSHEGRMAFAAVVFMRKPDNVDHASMAMVSPQNFL